MDRRSRPLVPPWAMRSSRIRFRWARVRNCIRWRGTSHRGNAPVIGDGSRCAWFDGGLDVGVRDGGERTIRPCSAASQFSRASCQWAADAIRSTARKSCVPAFKTSSSQKNSPPIVIRCSHPASRSTSRWVVLPIVMDLLQPARRCLHPTPRRSAPAHLSGHLAQRTCRSFHDPLAEAATSRRPSLANASLQQVDGPRLRSMDHPVLRVFRRATGVQQVQRTRARVPSAATMAACGVRTATKPPCLRSSVRFRSTSASVVVWMLGCTRGGNADDQAVGGLSSQWLPSHCQGPCTVTLPIDPRPPRLPHP